MALEGALVGAAVSDMLLCYRCCELASYAALIESATGICEPLLVQLMPPGWELKLGGTALEAFYGGMGCLTLARDA